MKKIFTILGVVAMATVAQAQGTENFNTLTNTTGTSYVSLDFTSADNTAWALTTTRIINTAANYNIEGTSAILNSNGTITITFPNGLGTLNFQYRKAFTGANARSIQVSVDGAIVETTAQFGAGSGGQNTIYDYSRTVNKSGRTVVEVKVLGAQTTLDNFSWTAPTLSVGDAISNKVVLVKNTQVLNTIEFGAKSNIKIYNMNGQIVKSSLVNEGTTLDVSSLSKGIYIVAGDVEGKLVSQKIIKK